MSCRHRGLILRRIYFIAALTFAGPFARVSAQLPSFHESWRWAHFTTESGLPSDQVFCVAETPGGTVWVGTEKGLAWFDNFGWNAIDSSRGIPSTDISSIEPFGADSILVLTRDGVYLGSRYHFSRLLSRDSLKDIQSVAPTDNGDILILGSVSLFAYSGGILRQIAPPARPILPRNLTRTRSGKIWLNTSRGVYKGDGKSWRLVFPAEVSAIRDFSVSEDTLGNGLAAMSWPPEMKGIHEWRRAGPTHQNSSERTGSQQAMDLSPNGDAIVIYQSGDIRFRRNGLWASIVPPPVEFTSSRIVKFRKDGDLWVGTEKGLFLFRASSKRWTYLRHPFSDPRNGVQEITQTSNGSIWLGTSDGIEIRRPNGRVDYIKSILGTELGPITGIIEDQRHHMWVCSGTTFPGAFRWDGIRWKHFGKEDGLNAARVHKIRSDRSGRLWFLGIGETYSDSVHQPGAFVYENGQFTRWGPGSSDHDGLPSGRVYGFAEAPNGARWFATLRGLSRWKEGKWHHWTGSHGLLLQNERIFTLAIDVEWNSVVLESYCGSWNCRQG